MAPPLSLIMPILLKRLFSLNSIFKSFLSSSASKLPLSTFPTFLDDALKERNDIKNDDSDTRNSITNTIDTKSAIIEPEGIENMERISIQDALSKLQTESDRLYCKIMLYSFPFTVTISDLITLHRLKNVPIGSRILLSQIKEIGSPSFSLKGNPLINPKFIKIEATVMSHGRGSKTSAAPKYQRKGRRPVKNLKPHTTTLRISRIQLVNNIK